MVGMTVLALDTSTWWASVAVVEDGEVLACRIGRAGSSHAIDLLPMIGETLQRAGRAFADIDVVAVTRGPGAFTGLRVGLSTAKGLCYATGARLVTVPTLEALAHSVTGYDGTVVVMLDARKGELYTARFAIEPAGACRRLEEDRLAAFDEIEADLPHACLIVGDAEEAYGDRMRALAGAGTRGIDGLTPPAVAVAKLAGMCPDGTDETMHAEPEYIRRSEAELNAVSA